MNVKTSKNIPSHQAERLPSRSITLAHLSALRRILGTAMRQTCVARIPECGEFGAIAQDASWLLTELEALANEQETVSPHI